MDLLQRLTKQFLELYRSMAPSQRGTLIAVPLLVIGGFFVLLWQNRTGSEAALSFGKVFTTEEIIPAEEALRRSGLKEFRRVGQQIMVPANEVDRYNAALLEFDALPTDLGSQMLKQLESMGPFSTDKQRQEMKEAMLLQELRRMLRAVPDVEDARVVVANAGKKSTWANKSRVTATVQVKPRGGRELSQKLVHALRSAVASMVPDLSPDHVTVFDPVHGVSYTGDAADDPFDSKLMQRIREFTQHYEQKIRSDLDYIPHVGVTVQVDLENVKSSVTRSQTVDPKKIAPLATIEKTSSDNLQQRTPRGQPGVSSNRGGARIADLSTGTDRTQQLTESETNTVNGVSFEVTEKALIAAMPKAVQVSISIPRGYYRDVALQRAAIDGQPGTKADSAAVEEKALAIEKEVLEDVKKSVAKLVPAGSVSEEVISVKSVDRLPTIDVEPTIPWTERGLQLGREWAGAIGLAMFAAWVLWQLRKLNPAATVASAPDLDAIEAQRHKLASATDSGAEDRPKEPTRRDLIQTLVRDNPEMTASVIGKWLQAAK
jgi:flagellar M-ring protein FliF